MSRRSRDDDSLYLIPCHVTRLPRTTTRGVLRLCIRPLHLHGGGRCRVGRVGHGLPKILVGWATMHLAHQIIGLYVC